MEATRQFGEQETRVGEGVLKYKLQDLVDLERFQALLERLDQIYCFPSAIIDNDGNILTKTAWQDVCTKFHRANHECEKECIKSDQYILDHLQEANPAVTYSCPHGLVDNAMPIVIDGVHYGNFFTGQFFFEKPDLEFFRGQARKYGFDEEAYLEAVKKVPIWTEAQVQSYLFFIKGLIDVISESGLKRLREIESRRQSEKNEQRQRAILQTAMDGFWIADCQGRLLQVNEAYCHMSGYPQQDLLGMRICDLEALETEEDTAAHMAKVAAEGGHRFETRHRRKDGSRFDVEVSVQYQTEGEGLYIVFLRDVTERKRTEAALADSERRFNTLFRTNPAAICVNTVDGGRIINVNDSFRSILGHGGESLVGRTVFDIGLWVDPAARQPLMTRVKAEGTVRNVEARFRCRNGEERDVLVSCERVELPGVGEPVTISMFVDITERKALETRLLQAQKMESLGMLAGGVAHDFNNSLAATMMHLSLLQRTPGLGQQALESLQELLGEAKRAAALTRQLLMFSRQAVIEIKVLNLHEVVENILKLLRRFLGEHITVHLECPTELPAVEADAGMIEQVLMNLALNARDAMPKGGRLSFRLEAVTVDAKRIEAPPQVQPGKYVRLSVTDTGCGMDEATRRRVFEPFFTTKEPGKGTGLGLATVYGIIQQHHGWVEVSSTLGQGSTFLVWLPGVDSRPVPVHKDEEAFPLPRGHEKILLVEDELGLRRALGRFLVTCGYTILEAGTGKEALEVWEGERGQIDLLLTDMAMPEGMSGLEIAQRLRSAKPSLKVIIISGYSTELLANEEKIRTKDILLLSKPVPDLELARAVRECLERGV